jgi:hypothetical protein
MRIARGTSRRLSAAGAGLALALLAAQAQAAVPRLLLRADFDREPSCLSKQVGSQPGAFGRGSALLLPAGAECVFPAQGHVSPRAGTLSFWVRPHDWNDGEGRYQVFFEWAGQVDGRPFQFYVDSPGPSKVVRLVLAYGNSRDPRQQLFQINAPATWTAGLWQKVDVTWDEREIVIYANGRAGERLPLETVRLPDPAGLRLRLTPGPNLGQRHDATVIDELELWDAAMPADRIAKRFQVATAPALAAPRLRAPRVAEAPRVDGALDDAAWQAATRVPLLADAETGFSPLSIAHASVAWSEAALHVGFEAPLTDPGDAVEITLAPAAGGTARSFRVTTRGLAAEDVMPGSPIEVAARSDADVWRVELSVPFAALRAALGAGSLLRFDLRQRPGAPGVLGVGARLADAALTLGDESEGVRIDAGADFALGRIALELERNTKASVEVELARTQGGPWRERLDLRGKAALREQPEPPAGVVRIAARDDANRELVRIESRLARLDVPGLLAVPEPEARRLGVEVDLGWLDGSWLRALAAGRGTARLLDRGPKGTETHELALDAGRGRASFVSGLAPGQHTLALELRAPGREVVLERALEVPKLPWLGERLGESERVPEPWLPLAWDDDATVRVYGRSYAFDGPLLARVSNETGPILRAPMQLRLRSAAGEAPLRTTAVEAGKRSAGRAELAGAGRFDAAAVDVAWSSAIEYDGLVVTTLTLTPQKPGTRVEQLVLDVPLAPRIARYLRGMQQGSTIRRGRTAWDGQRYESAFEPFVWLSNEKEGFLYFAESAANWVGAERKDALVVRGGADAGITLRLIGEPVVLPGPITYTLGFQATPVKPELKDGRAWNFGVAGTPTPNETAISWYNRYAAAEGTWELQRPVVIAQRDRELASRGVRPFYYATTSAAPDHQPVFRLFEALWRSAWSYSYEGEASPESGLRGPIPEHRLTAVCPADASLQARMLHDAKELLELGVVGLYTDTDEVFADDNTRHGCGYRDAFGRRGPSWSILSKRRFAQRLAALLRETGGERHYWMSHAHTRLVPPVHGLADFWYPGEELTNALRKDIWLYSDVVDDDAWRVEYRSASSGIVHIFLPEFWRGSGDPKHLETPQPTESMLAMAAVNDVNVSSAYTNPEATGEYWGLRKKLGLIEAEFVGHWEPGCPVRALQPEARASVYRTKKGPVLVVASRAAKPQSIEVQLDRAALGLGASVEARNVRTSEKLALTGDRLSVPLAARSYTYVTLR